VAGSPSISIDVLLAHSSWLRRLAAHLVSDPEVDDLVQETWTIALEKPPRVGTDPRRWLARVLTNRAANRHREKDTRAWHERSAGKTEEWSPSEIENRVTLQRQLAEAVLGLEDPYRTAIALHYFEGLSAKQIAERQVSTEEAVRQHLTRGREKLRGRLDREFGGREAWCLLFVNALRKGGAAPVAAGTGKLVALSAVAAALALLSLFVWVRVRSKDVPHNENAAYLAEPVDEGRSRIRSEPTIETSPGSREALGGNVARVEPDHQIRGVVLGAGKQPVPGAAIVVFHDERSGYQWDPEAETVRNRIAATVSDAQGVFAVEVPPGRPFDLEVSAGGYATATLAYRYAGEGITIQLGAGAIVEGQATRAAGGKPVSGARLEITTQDGTIKGARLLLRQGETDEAGRFRFDNLPGVTVSVRLTPRSLRAPASRVVAIEPGGKYEVDFVVEAGATISGRVLDEATRLPIANAKVGEARRLQDVGADGAYEYSGVPPPTSGPIVLLASAPGYTPASQVFHEAVDREDLPEHFDFVLRKGVSVGGRVVDAARRPMPDVYVETVQSPSSHSSLAEAVRIRGRTNDRGRFDLANVSRDLALTLLVRHEGSGDLVRSYPANPGAVEVGDLVLAPEFGLHGVVMDADGKPAPDRMLTLKRVPAPEGVGEGIVRYMTERNARSDDRGRFVFSGLAEGTYTVGAWQSEFGDRYDPRLSATVSIAPGQEIPDVQVLLGRYEELSGHLVDAAGHGIGGLVVRTVKENAKSDVAVARTDAEGKFTLTGLTAKTYRLQTTGTGRADDGRVFLQRDLGVVVVGGRDPVFSLEAGVLLLGRVLDTDGRAVGDGTVEGRVPGRDGTFGAFTNADGTFSLIVPVDASIDISAFAGSDTSRTAHEHRLTSDPSELVLRLPR
jgi:RNA polymerase sigma-70 factor (ECF subfamily)